MSSDLNAVNSKDRWQRFVESQCWERGNLDQASYFTFLRAGSLGVSPGEAIETVATRIKAAGDHPRQAKLNQQLRRAYGFASASHQPHGCYHVHREMRPAFAPDYARNFAERIPASVDQAWLRKRSPVRVPYLLTPAEFLFAAYEMGDQILVFSDYRSQGQELWQKYSFKVEPDDLASFVRGHSDGIWFLANPVDGAEHFNERQQKMSRRSEESITAFRYAVLESDCQTLEQWLKILVQLPLPIVSITSSGGKSLHALVRVDAESKAAWDQLVRGQILPRLVPLGVDPQALTAIRLTRLPNCYRGGQMQELLYLNPNATSQPIFQR
jgi:hypothetical protein